MDPGLVSEDFPMDSPKRFPLVLHGFLWGFPNREATQGGNFFTLLIFLGIIRLLESLRFLKIRIDLSYGAKPRAPSHIVQEYFLFTTAWPCIPL